MRISVIVPLYNKAAYINRCLDSIAAQTLRDFEAIVVNDGSTDGSDGIAAAYPDSRFRVVSQANAGPGAARNAGLREARGELVAFLDADDAWMPQYLEESVELLDRCDPSTAAVVSGFVMLPGGLEAGPIWKSQGIAEGIHRTTAETSPRLFGSLVAAMCPWNTVSRTAVLRRWHGFYDRYKCLFGEDGALWIKLLLNESICFQYRVLVEYHREASVLTSNAGGPRPVEPFLLDPEDVTRTCPPELRELLAAFIAMRACRTATMLGYWGRWREARSVLRPFVPARRWRTPLFIPARVAATPAAVLLGALLRGVASLLPHSDTPVAWRAKAVFRAGK